MQRKGQIILDKFTGMSRKYGKDKINLYQAYLMQNLDCINGYNIKKRQGQSYYLDLGVASGINGLYYYKNKIISAVGTKLFADGVEIYNSLTSSEVTFFIYNGLLYILNGYQFLTYDGTTIADIEAGAYAPLIFINAKADLTTKDKNEELNLLSGSFRVQYITDGATTVFKLPYTSLDSIDTITGFGTYTVDLVAGTVTFTTAPPTGTNILEIKATKSSLKDSSQIKACRYAYEYNKKIFLAGNLTKPNQVWIMAVTDKYDATYFPAFGFEIVGGNEESITGFASYYDKLLIFKDKSIYLASYATVGENTYIQIPSLNKGIGCDMPGSIQIINNAPVFCNTYRGVCTLVSTALENEKNVMTVSGNANPMLLLEPKEILKQASSVDYDGRYWLCVGDKAYIWDYKSNGDLSRPDDLVWIYYTNINASKFLITDRLLYGSRSVGKIVQFITALNDFGQPINAIWQGKQMDFDKPLWYKTVPYLSFISKPDVTSELTLKYVTDNGTDQETEEVSFNTFAFSLFSFSTFSFNANEFPQPIKMKPMSKKVIAWQLEISNNNLNEDLEISKIYIDYILEKEVR